MLRIFHYKIAVPQVPLDNNHAKRCLRELAIHRKIKGHISRDALLVLLRFSESCQLQRKTFGKNLEKFWVCK